MSTKILKLLLFGLILIHMSLHNAFAQVKEIALTIDDLPFVGLGNATKGNLQRVHDRFTNILNYLIDAQIPATGFIIAHSIASGQWELLEDFRKAGFALGNHTYSHGNLNHMSADRYIQDQIAKADKILEPIMTHPKYFRYPYLAEGRGATKQAVQDYLAENHYIIAPVTIDSKDYQFNEQFLHIPWRIRDQYVSKIKQQYLNYVWKQTLNAEKRSKDGSSVQILLVHSNLLNSHCLGDLIKMYKDNGYQFVTLEEALAHQPATTTTSEIQDQKVSFNQLDALWLWLQGYPIEMKVDRI